MGTEQQQIVSEVVQKTNSELILFFVLMIIVLVIFVIPLYRMMLKDRSEKTKQEDIRQDKYIEREKQIIQVITANTEVMAGLKATLETNGVATTASLERISGKITDTTANNAQIITMLDRSISNQTEMASKINKILLIVDSIPNTSNFSKYNCEPPPDGVVV